MATFALVHGAWHGSWCWDPLAGALRSKGHQVVAPDLPCDDASAGVPDYADTVLAALDEADAGSDVVLVGHSLGGLTIPAVAARRPVRQLVFLAAVVAAPGRSLLDTMRQEAMFPTGLDDVILQGDDGRSRLRTEAVGPAFYQDCPPELRAQAAGQLRPQGNRPITEPVPLDSWPDVECRYIVCADDRVVRPEWQREVGAPRVGAAPEELGGGHSPFLARPAELAEMLVRGGGSRP